MGSLFPRHPTSVPSPWSKQKCGHRDHSFPTFLPPGLHAEAPRLGRHVNHEHSHKASTPGRGLGTWNRTTENRAPHPRGHSPTTPPPPAPISTIGSLEGGCRREEPDPQSLCLNKAGQARQGEGRGQRAPREAGPLTARFLSVPLSSPTLQTPLSGSGFCFSCPAYAPAGGKGPQTSGWHPCVPWLALDLSSLSVCLQSR